MMDPANEITTMRNTQDDEDFLLNLKHEQNNNDPKIHLDTNHRPASQYYVAILLRRAVNAVSRVAIVRNPDSAKLACSILVCFLVGISNFPNITLAIGFLYGLYCWWVYKAWCEDFSGRSSREMEDSPSNKDVPLLVAKERSVRRKHTMFWRQKKEEGMEKGQRILKVTHSFCRCTGKELTTNCK